MSKSKSKSKKKGATSRKPRAWWAAWLPALPRRGGLAEPGGYWTGRTEAEVRAAVLRSVSTMMTTCRYTAPLAEVLACAAADRDAVVQDRIVVERDKGWWVASFPALQGARSMGRTKAQAVANMWDGVAEIARLLEERADPAGARGIRHASGKP